MTSNVIKSEELGVMGLLNAMGVLGVAERETALDAVLSGGGWAESPWSGLVADRSRPASYDEDDDLDEDEDFDDGEDFEDDEEGPLGDDDDFLDDDADEDLDDDADSDDDGDDEDEDDDL
jgi:hypothetical protein